jgi:hypothetical protein
MWTAGALLAPVVLFPAFAQDMTLYRQVHSYFLAITFMAAILWIGALVWRIGRRLVGALRIRASEGMSVLRGRSIAAALPVSAQHRVLLNAMLMVVVVALTVVALARIGENWLAELGSVRARYFQQDIARSFSYLEALRRFDNGMFMTNINTPLVGLLTRQPGFGVCGGESIERDGRAELRHCKIAMMRNSARYLAQRPRYFFFFTTHFPGFATCRPLAQKLDPSSGLPGDKCHELQRKRLSELFSVSFESPEVVVFDLSSRRSFGAIGK